MKDSIVIAADRNPPLPLPDRPNKKQIAHWLRDKAAFERSQYGGRQMDAREWAATCLTCAAEDLERALPDNNEELVSALLAIDKLTCNAPCMSLQANHEFDRNKAAEAYKIELAKLIINIREQARAALAQKGPL